MSVKRMLATTFFRLSRWKLVVEEPTPTRGAILIGAPHTSNWDFILMLAISAYTGVRYHFLGKNSLFRGPAGPIMRSLGGIPVDRGSRHGLVESLAAEFAAHPGFVLAITPKGTRGKREYWHSGFYRIAEATGLPLQMCFVDSRTRTTGLGPVMAVTGDVHADMDRIRDFFADKVGIKPELTSTPRLTMEES